MSKKFNEFNFFAYRASCKNRVIPLRKQQVRQNAFSYEHMLVVVVEHLRFIHHWQCVINRYLRLADEL